MLIKATITILLGLFIAPFAVCARYSPVVDQGNIVSIFFLPGVCKTNSPLSAGVEGCPYKSNFLLHGLWPSSGFNCKTSVGLESIPQNIYVDAQKVFYANLMSHEWEKHGSCSGMTPEAYVIASINAYKKYSGIVNPALLPLMKKGSASMQQILGAIANTGFSAILACKNGQEDNTKLYLTEVRICVDSNYSMPRPCGSLDDTEHSCGEGNPIIYLS